MHIIKFILKNHIKLKYFLVLVSVISCGLLYSCNKEENLKNVNRKEVPHIEETYTKDTDIEGTYIEDIHIKDTYEIINSAASKEIENNTDGDHESLSLPDKNNNIFVYVCGSVNIPGVYELEEGSRVIDAVELAGGLSKEARAEYVNLARFIKDEERIYIPDTKDINSGKFEIDKNFDIRKEETSKTKNVEVSYEKEEKLDLNKATKKELMSLKGIGEKKAEAILNYREKNGAFSSVKELMNIQGIKGNAYEKIKDFICVR